MPEGKEPRNFTPLFDSEKKILNSLQIRCITHLY